MRMRCAVRQGLTAEASYLDGIDKAYPVNIYVKKLWEEFGDEAEK